MQLLLTYKGDTIVFRNDQGRVKLLHTKPELQSVLHPIEKRLNDSDASDWARKLPETTVSLVKIMDLEEKGLSWYYNDTHFLQKMVYPLLEPEHLYSWHKWYDVFITAAHGNARFITGGINRRDLVARIKELRRHARWRHATAWHRAHPVEKYGFFSGNWLASKIDQMRDGLEFVDNIRYARVNSRKDMRYYKRMKKSGCCGFVDIEVRHILYGKFIIGCNYGH